MGIGRTFEEAYQKAIRMLDLDFEGATSEKVFSQDEPEADIIAKYLYTPTPKRMFALAMAMRNNISVAKIADVTGIDPWFLERIKHIVDLERGLQASQDLSASRLRALKQMGVSDKRIGELTGKTGLVIRALRKQLGITPYVFQIDTLAGEFPSDTNYLYMTYNAQHHDVEPYNEEGVIILGSGPYRIGSSVEFDWTSVSTVEALKKHHKRSIVINCNPETVSTDYDTSERLYFEELTFERIADIYEFELPYGVIVSVGGQTPNNRAKALQNYGAHILGTDARNIDRAEDRSKFSALLDKLDIRQPEWNSFTSIDELTSFAERVGYPVLVRPSYVLSGSAMNVCYTQEELEQYTKEAAAVSPEHPVTVSKFLRKVKEIELDAVAQRGEIKAFVVSEHIENAGVHSGDATIVLPPQNINVQTRERIEEVGRAVAKALEITGPFNMQFLAKDNQVYVIEVNLRASRTFPFISKVTGINFMEMFVDAIFEEKEIPAVAIPSLTFTAVKAPQFSFSRLTGADPILRVEMSSTGEVACFGEDVEEAYLKAIIATGGRIPQKGIFISLGGAEKKVKFLESAGLLATLGIPLYATEKTAAFLRAHGIEVTTLYKIHEEKAPNVLTYFRDNKIDLAINVVDGYIKKEVDDDYAMRRYAVDHNIPLFTKVKQARLFIKAITEKDLNTIPIKAWNEY
ncbi:MAG: carbamoyl-phosphate synthase large subunit, partial [Chloroflexi bacterium]|nr:carbamoyl-phosphate synthase large subunit [Chloroflexota bacterium]